MNIEVEFNIGDVVSLVGGKEGEIIGYEYIKDRGIRYVVLQEERRYCYKFEIKKANTNTIGFIPNIKE